MLKLHRTLKRAFPENKIESTRYFSATLDHFIQVNEANVTFKMQEGPVNERGENGVQINELLEFTKAYVEIMNQGDYECTENHETIKYISMAIQSQKDRESERKSRGVEGYSKGQVQLGKLGQGSSYIEDFIRRN